MRNAHKGLRTVLTRFKCSKRGSNDHNPCLGLLGAVVLLLKH